MSEKKVALITGSTKGLGREVALRLADSGYHVIASGRDLTAASKLAEDIRANGGSASALRIDLADASTFAPAAAEVERTFGKLDVLVNNAGVFREGSWWGNTTQTVGIATLRDTFETNFFGQVQLTQVLLPLLEKSPAANIVNVSSALGSVTIQADPKSPFAPVKPLAYNASKSALNAFSVHLAAALAETSIQVNVAHPGWVRTDLGSDAAPLSVEEGAKTIVDLATLPPGSYTGRFIHQQDALPW